MSAWPIAFDPAVPHRDRLLDAGEMRAALARESGQVAAIWRVGKVKYHPGRDLRVVYRGTSRRGPAIVAARARSRVQQTRFSTFPYDRRLPQLADLVAPSDAMRALLAGAWTSSRLAGYAPEKSAVVACLDGNPRRPIAFAKHFASEQEAGAAFAIATCVADRFGCSASDCRVPRPLLLANPRLLILEAAHGDRLSALEETALVQATARLGTALAELHASDVPLPHAAERTDDARLEDAARDIAAACPDLAEAARALAQALIATRPAPTGVVPLHGDVHLKNALLDGSRLWLIDFDQAHAGPAAADLGSFLAALRTEALIGARTHQRAAALANAFLRGYAAVRALPPAAELRWHLSAALFAERARRGVTRLRRNVLVHLATLLEDADRNLRRGAA
jgi:tRNA A-37 threonylcarbamoyl transferase component Bud32